MSKSLYDLKVQHQQQISCNNQELIDIALLNNLANESDFINCSLKFKQPNLKYSNQYSNESLEIELENLKLKNKELIIKFNSQSIELEDCKRNLSLKDAKLDEMKQSIESTSHQINQEIINSQKKIYSSVLNVNNRLEKEILMLKNQLIEQNLINNKLSLKKTEQDNEIEKLLEHLNKFNHEKNFKQ